MEKKRAKARKEPVFFKIVPSAIFGLTGLFYLAAPFDLVAAMGLSFGVGEGEKLLLAGVMIGGAVVLWFLKSKVGK